MVSVLCILAITVTSVLAATESNIINFGGFICPKEVNALSKCLRDALNAYIPQLSTGLPEFGVPPCEPLVVPTMMIQQSAGPIAITSTYSDVTVSGPSTMRIKDINIDTNKNLVTVQIYIPELKMKGNYNIAGQILLLPIEGEGRFKGKYGDINAVVTIKLGRQHRTDAPDALTCEQLDVKFQVGSATFQLDNLFGGDSELGNAMNKFLNENWQKLAEELQTPMEEALRDFLKPLADHAFGTLNADDILVF